MGLIGLLFSSHLGERASASMVWRPPSARPQSKGLGTRANICGSFSRSAFTVPPALRLQAPGAARVTGRSVGGVGRVDQEGRPAIRFNYSVIAPEAPKALAGVNAALLRAGLDKRLMDLLFLRVSQINGCSYCVDEHARDLRRAGESNERLDGLAGWRESPYFTDPEKSALEWAEVLTRVESTHAPDAAYEPLARHYDEKEAANITYAIALMNAWNRIAIAFRKGPEPRSAGSP
jgi:AhpD family alkylhydroperoxidase